MTRRIVRGEPRLSPEEEEHRKLYLRKAFSMADLFRLDDDERHDLAHMIATVPAGHSGSWGELNILQLHELIMYLEGFAFVSSIIEMRA